MQNIGATWISLHWESPLEVDFPISYYEIVVTKLIDVGAAQQENRSTLDNSTFINVTGLSPDTTYNFSIVAVIEAGEVVARSDRSAVLEDIRTTAAIGMKHHSVLYLCIHYDCAVANERFGCLG